MSHSSEEAADIATGSITEAAFEQARAQVEREDGASGAVEAEENRLAKKAPGASERGIARIEVDAVAEAAAEVEAAQKVNKKKEHGAHVAADFALQAEEEQPERPKNTD